ncbi:MAG TPA: fibronectin type III domain-containing protein [Solirubrobacteraceae bacterium]|jgi:hypothetical protein|nr:fibronectin type III domain-containing protein [Solirubrobacteraceae bacterium]
MPVNTRRSLARGLVVVAAMIAVWMVGGAAALAAAPETPRVEVRLRTATTVTLRGVLNPSHEGETGTYEFLYRRSASECVGEDTTARGLSFGVQGEEVSQELSGLQPGVEYSVCLLARDLDGEQTVGPAVPLHVTTAIPPAAPETGKAEAVGSSTAVLHGVLNPGETPSETGEYEFVYRATGGGCAGEGENATTADATSGRTEAVSGEATGLQPGTEYAFCLVARNAAGETEAGSPVTFTTAGVAPNVVGESFANVGSGDATLSAQIDTGGLASTYHFEYGTGESFTLATPTTSIAAVAGTTSVSAQISGLRPNTGYRFRVTVSNADGAASGAGEGFVTFPPTSSALPDGRVYELVSPPSTTHEINVYAPAPGEIDDAYRYGISSTSPFQAATGGEAVVYPGDPPPTGGTGHYGNGQGNEYRATRSPGGGWTQESIQPPEGLYKAFSPNLAIGILSEAQGLTADAPEYINLYAAAGGEYRALVTTDPSHRTTEEFGYVREAQDERYGGPYFAGGNAGTGDAPTFSHLLFEANDSLPSSPQAVDGGELKDNLYDAVAGRLYLVNVLPDGEPEPGAAFGSLQPREERSNRSGLSHVISADGSRIFWTALEAVEEGNGNGGIEIVERPKALYVRENDTQPQSPFGENGECLVSTDACTVQVDAAVGGGGTFLTASADGSKAVFMANGELYEYDLESGQTVDLSAGRGAQGVVGASENGEYVYYVDADYRLILWHAGAATVIATLSPEDDGISWISNTDAGESGDWQADLGHRTAEVTPDGQNVVFMSTRSLTGYDNVYENRFHVRTPLDEVYLYNAQLGQLTCVSCNRSGEPPVGNTFIAGEDYERPTPIGAYLMVSFNATYQPRAISEDGDRVFFVSTQPLLPQATNGLADVYEWERDGAGSCQESEGCLYLLSGGTSNDNSYFVDASTSGEDAFIVTRAQLVAQDRSDDEVVYDARVGGAQPPATSACSGSGCQGAPPAPPIFATPASATFNGVGNFEAPSSVQVAHKTKSKARHRPKSKAGHRKSKSERKRGHVTRRPKRRRPKASAERRSGR